MADLNIKKVTVSGVNYDIEDSAARELANSKSTVSVSASGTATDTVQYITVDGVEKKLAGSSGEPDAYLKNATTSGNTLTLTKKDNSTVTFTPTEVAVVGASTDEENDVGETVKIWIDTTESYAELDDPQIVQVPGQSTMKVMSQKAVTDEIATKSAVSVSATGTSSSEVQYITIDGAEYKLTGGGSGEPAAYLKSASASGNTLTLVNKDNSTVTFTPTDTYQGTVKSVGAGTGLNISGTATVNPTVNVASGYKLPTTSEWGNKLDKNTAITGATKTKITYDSNGLVTAGADLAASDIPNLSTSKITSGTFADARIASASTWNAKQDALTASNNITIDASNNISALKYYKQSEVTGVAGTSSTQLSSTYNVTDASVTSYYDGMLVTFVLPCAGVSTYGSVFQFNSLGYHPIVYGTSSVIGTRYSVGSQITMVYNSVQTATAYLTKDTKTTITGCWQVCDYDQNTTDAYALIDYNFRPYAGSVIYRYKLCLQDKDNRLQPIVTTNQERTTQVVKTVNTTPLRPEQIWFYNSTDTVSVNFAVGKYKLMASDYGNFCSYNFNETISAYRMIYLAGNYDSTTGLFTLDNSTTTSYYALVPNRLANITLSSYLTSGKYYILVGSSFGSNDELQLFVNNPMYYFDGTNLIPYQEHLVALKQDASTLEADVAAKGFTKNTGTVTSVQVQAGTGLASSQSSAQTGTLNTTISVASGYKLPTTSEWSGKQDTLTSGLVDVIASGNPSSPVEIWVDESEIYGETDYGSIVQSLGTEINKVMSQNAVRVALSDYVRFYPNRIYSQTDVNTYLSDVNNAINNNIYILQMYNVTTMPANLPSGFPNDGSVRYLITIPSEVQGSTQLTQLIFNGNFETIYSRSYYSGSWKAWKISTNVSGETKTIGASGDFETLKAGLAYAYANPNTTLILQEGTYNIINEYGGTLSGQGMPIGHGTHLICSPKAKVVCNYTGGDSTIQEIFSVFYAQEGDFTVENLNIETSNIRYCFHDDIGTYSYQGVRNIHRFINCTMSHNNSASPHAARFPQCIGGGLGKDQVIEIIGGCYTTTADSNTNGTISYHNCAEADSRSEIIIKDVYFGGAKGGVRFGWYGNSTLVTKCYVTNCSCTYAPFTRAEVTTAPYENMILMAWNNEIRS